MNNSIFRTEKIACRGETPQKYDFDSSTRLIIKNYRTHDDGIPRGREYSLNSIIQFSIFKGYKIKAIMEEDLDYFLWFPRKIKSFTYDKEVLDYADKCLEMLIRLSQPNIKNFPKLKYAYEEVSKMLQYEYELDYGKDPFLREAYKSMVNVNFYKKIINEPIEKLLRQSLTNLAYSNEYRGRYLNELRRSYKYNKSTNEKH